MDAFSSFYSTLVLESNQTLYIRFAANRVRNLADCGLFRN